MATTSAASWHAPRMTTPSAVTRLILIRHGESASNAGGWISGQETCGGLTPLGIRQAEAARDRLAAEPAMQPDRIVVSTMRRAVETADIVAAPTGVAPEQFADLMERTSGEAEGMTIDEYVERYGQRPWADWEQPLSAGGESGVEFSVRVRDALDRVASEAPGRTTWVVCHGGVIMSTSVGRWPTGDTAPTMRHVPVASPANSSISEWHIDEAGAWTMARFNDHTHLVGVSDGEAPPAI